MATQIYNGKELASTLTSFGLACSFLQQQTAPQLTTYHFNITNFNTFCNLKTALKKLEMITHSKIKQVASEFAHFALEFIRNKKETINFVEVGGILANKPKNTILFGFDTLNRPITATLNDLPHLLVAGTTGSGKSVALHSYITSLICYNKPTDLGLVLFDLKQNEFNVYKGIPHLMTDIVNDSEQAEYILQVLVKEMERRYKFINQKYCTILVVIDELSDLIAQNENCKTLLLKLLRKARACDMHFIVATQSPRAKVLDGEMLANLPSRVCLTASNVRESVLVLGHKGCEELTGNGDCIIKFASSTKEYRVQTPYITQNDIEKLK